jgi:hypothetical protein
MPEKRIQIIPRIHGKRTRDGKISEPDIYWILDKWLQRHPEAKGREQDIRIVRGQWHTRDDLPTDVISVSILPSEDLTAYNPADDVDLYEYYLADEWQGEG